MSAGSPTRWLALLCLLLAGQSAASELDDCEAAISAALKARFLAEREAEAESEAASERDSAATSEPDFAAASEPDSESDSEVAFEPEPLPSLENTCPELAAQLAAHPMAGVLARDPDRRGVNDIRGIEKFTAFYRDAESRSAPGRDALQRALDGLETELEREMSLREQFWAWVARTFFPEGANLPDWLEGVSVSEEFFVNTFIALLVLIVLLALGLVGNELRYARFRGRRRHASDWSLEAGVAQRPLSWEDLASLPLPQQPGALLTLVLGELAEQGQLQSRVSATHRDLAAQAGSLQQGDRLVLLCRAAERSAYGGWNPSSEDVATLKGQAQQLLNRDPAP